MSLLQRLITVLVVCEDIDRESACRVIVGSSHCCPKCPLSIKCRLFGYRVHEKSPNLTVLTPLFGFSAEQFITPWRVRGCSQSFALYHES